MRIWKFIFYIGSLLISTNVFGDTFVVTSNADNGAGTLREAIQKAASNGTTVQDLISFNIADQTEQGRTIDVQSEMPFLTGNLTLDGTTQPGAAIGISNAKIIIQLSRRVSDFRCFTIRDASNVEIFGLFFYQSFINFFLSTKNNYAVYFRKVDNLVIGKPGKGNYFIGFNKAIGNWIDANIPENYLPSDTSNTLTVQSNVFGLAMNGDLPNRTSTIYGIVFNPIEQAVYLRNARNVLVGGSQPSERNYIVAPDAITYASDSLKGNGYFKVIGNYIGVNLQGKVDLNGNSSSTFGKVWIKNSNSFYGIDPLVEIKMNRIGGAIDLGYTSNDVLIQANVITSTGVFSDNTSNGSYQSSALIKCMAFSGKIMIGGEDASDGNDISLFNYITPGPLYGQLAIQSGASSILKGAVEIKNNTLHCNTTESSSIYNGAQGLPYRYNADTSTLWVIIDSTGSGFVKGRACRNARIDIYLDDECRACEGKQMIGSTVSDSSGNWSFGGNFSTAVVATVTRRGNTWGFSTPIIITDSVKLQPPTCNMNNGSIKGLKMIGGDNFEWRYSADGNFSSSVLYSTTALDIINLKPGTYFIMGKIGSTCYGWLRTYTFKNYSPRIRASQVRSANASCGQFNGSVTQLTVDSAEYSRFEWRSNSGLVISKQKDLLNAGPGSYKFFAIDTSGGGCIDSTVMLTINNQSGPTVDINNIQITHASCGQSNGSIKNIQVLNAFGSSYFRWEDSLKNIIGNSLDLRPAKGGKYRLKYKDGGGCDTIVSNFFTVQDIGAIRIDTINKKVKVSACALNNGSIKGIVIIGGTTIEWKDNMGSTVSTTADAANLAPGNYQLVVRNDAGCSQSLPVINIPPSSFIPISVITSTKTNATCDSPNGFVSNLVFSSDTSKYNFLWTDSSSQTPVGRGTSLRNIAGGSYVLSATDTNGCSQPVFKVTLLQFRKPVFDSSALLITPDQCSQSAGAIKQMKINGLLGQTTYEWLNSVSATVGNNIHIQSLINGYYRLKVTDGGNCIITSNPIFVKDSLVIQVAPVYTDTVIARNTPAYLMVKNYTPGNYMLFAGNSSPTAIDQNKTGDFTLSAVAVDKTFFIEYHKGTCKSERVPVTVKVVDETSLIIPNVFSPNGDGINDLFRITVTGLLTLKDLTIYTRDGQKIFSTADINVSWDGKFKGSTVPIGTYYYTLHGSDVYAKPIHMQGSITVLR